MNLVCTSIRNRLLIERISNLMFVKLHGPPMDAWNPDKYAKSWLQGHHTADDQRVRKRNIDETPKSEKKQTAAKQGVWRLL